MNTDPVDKQSAQVPATAGWRASILTLVASRIELIQIELRQALKDRSRALTALVAGILCAFFTWALLLAGGIAALAETLGCPWHFLALLAAGLHLLATLVLFKSAKAPQAEAFPVTRSEFQKDREWIESLQKTPESRN